MIHFDIEYFPREHLITDDESLMGTYENLRELASKYPPINIVHDRADDNFIFVYQHKQVDGDKMVSLKILKGRTCQHQNF